MMSEYQRQSGQIRVTSLQGRQMRLAWALLASLALHLMIIADVGSLHWWQPGVSAGASTPLEVQLLPLATPGPHATMPPPIIPAPRPLPVVPPMPDDEILAAAPPLETGMTVEPAPAAQGRHAADDLPAAPAQQPVKPSDDKVQQRLPANGQLTYKFFWGKSRWLAGQAIHQWTMENGYYTLTSTVSTTGIFELLHPLKLVESSKGKIINDTLRPLQFSTQLNEYPPAVAIFDWEAGNYRWFRGKQRFTQPLPGNSYDKISYLYQLYLDPQREKYFSSEITMGRHLEHYEILNLGEEEIEIDGSLQQALHLTRATNSPDMEKIDIWLSTSFNYLPLKMTYANQAGDHFEQLIMIDSLPGR